MTARPVDRVRPLLTPRRVEILRLVANGYTNRQIARELCCSVGTVKSQLDWTFLRLGVTDRTHAVGAAFALGLLVPADIHPTQHSVQQATGWPPRTVTA
jgi:DNA-binding NarL/FixJ family response regulator